MALLTSPLSHVYTSPLSLPPPPLSLSLSQVDLDPLRLNWTRGQASLLTNNSSHYTLTKNRNPDGSLTASASDGDQRLDALWIRMNRIIRHSRYVDKIEDDLGEYALLKELWWYREKVMEVFNKCINMVGGAEPRHCIAFMRLLNNSMANIHRFCPEEQKLIGEEAVSRVTADLKAVCTAVTTLMSTSL